MDESGCAVVGEVLHRQLLKSHPPRPRQRQTEIRNEQFGEKPEKKIGLLQKRQRLVPAIGRGLAGGHETAGCVADLDEEVADPA